MLNIGDKAPSFKLKDQDGKEHSLKDYEGKWILIYFYPKDNTSGCTKEACSIRDSWQEFRDNNVIVLGVSKDSVESHKKFEGDHKLPFTLLSDPEREVIKAYEATRGLATARTSYLISPHGTIAHVFSKVNTETHAMDVLEELERVGEVGEKKEKI